MKSLLFATFLLFGLTGCDSNSSKFTLERKFTAVSNQVQEIAANANAYGTRPSMCEAITPAEREELTGWAIRTMQTEYMFRERGAHEVRCMHHVRTEVIIGKNESRSFYDEPDFLSVGDTIKLEATEGGYILHRTTSQGYKSEIRFKEDEVKQDSAFAVSSK